MWRRPRIFICSREECIVDPLYLETQAQRGRLVSQYRAEARGDHSALEFDPFEGQDGASSSHVAERDPIPLAQFINNFTSDAQFTGILTMAQTRQAIPNSWELRQAYSPSPRMP